MIDRHLGQGFFPSVTWNRSTVWCAWQEGGTLIAATFDAGLQPIKDYRWPLTSGALAFPVLTKTAVGETLVVYRDGAPDYAIRLRFIERGLVEELALNGGGNKPCAINAEYVAWQDAGFGVWRSGLLGGLPTLVRPGAPTGLSRLRADGWPILWDEDFASIPGMTSPAFADPVTVGEHPAGGVAGLWAGLSGRLHLWPGADTRSPSAAYSAALGRVAVATWGDTGIRLGIAGPDDVQAVPAPWIAPLPRSIWAGYFFQFSNRYGDTPNPIRTSWTFVGEPGVLPRVQMAVVLDASLITEAGTQWMQVVAVWVSGNNTQDVEGFAREAREDMDDRGLPRKPILGYVDAGVSDRIPAVEIFGLQCYADPGESLPAALARFRSQLARVPVDRSVVLVCQAYDRNGAEPDSAKVEALQREWAELARADARIIGLLWFSDGRPGGTREHSAWRQWHVATMDAVPPGPHPAPEPQPGPPPVVTPPPVVQPPPVEPPPEEPMPLTFWPLNEDHIEEEILAPLSRLEQTYFGGADITHGAFAAWVLGYRGVLRHAFDVLNERFAGKIPADGEVQRKVIQAGYRRMMIELIAVYPHVPTSEVPPDPFQGA